MLKIYERLVYTELAGYFTAHYFWLGYSNGFSEVQTM